RLIHTPARGNHFLVVPYPNYNKTGELKDGVIWGLGVLGDGPCIPATGIEGRRTMSKRFVGSRQTTLGREIELSGIGVHSGAPVSMVLHPADADTGYRFLVTKRGRIVADIPGHVDQGENLKLCPRPGHDIGV